jgi:hypothetical protein
MGGGRKPMARMVCSAKGIGAGSKCGGATGRVSSRMRGDFLGGIVCCFVAPRATYFSNCLQAQRHNVDVIPLAPTAGSFLCLSRVFWLFATPSSQPIHSNSISLLWQPKDEAHRSNPAAYPSRSSRACARIPAPNVIILQQTHVASKKYFQANWAADSPAEARALRTSLHCGSRPQNTLPDA